MQARRQARHFVAMAWPWGIQVGITRSRVSALMSRSAAATHLCLWGELFQRLTFAQARELPSACLDENISREGLEPLALGIAEWHAQISPAGDCAVFFRDSAFEDDVAKTNLVAILEQRGFGNVRSL